MFQALSFITYTLTDRRPWFYNKNVIPEKTVAYFLVFVQLLLPTYRALRVKDYPIDNIGVQPDLYLDDDVSEWVEFAREYLEN